MVQLWTTPRPQTSATSSPLDRQYRHTGSGGCWSDPHDGAALEPQPAVGARGPVEPVPVRHHGQDAAHLPPQPAWQVLEPRTRPGAAPVGSPSSMTGSPLTMTQGMDRALLVIRVPPPGMSSSVSSASRPDGVGVEDHHVRRLAHLEGAAIGQAEEVRHLGGQRGDPLLEREAALLAHPVLEEVAGVVAAGEGLQVRAGVGDADQGGRALQDPLQVGLVDVHRTRDPEERLQLVLERDVEHDVGRADAPLLGDVDQQAALERLRSPELAPFSTETMRHERRRLPELRQPGAPGRVGQGREHVRACRAASSRARARTTRRCAESFFSVNRVSGRWQRAMA